MFEIKEVSSVEATGFGTQMVAAVISGCTLPAMLALLGAAIAC